MIRSVAGKVAWVGRTAAMVFGLALVLALVLGVATVALAAVPGDPFELGQTNTINNALTTLTGSNAGGSMLVVDNDSAASGARALDLRVEPGKQPLNVNAEAGKAGNLNADKLDGKGADGLVRVAFFDGIGSPLPKGENGTVASTQITAPAPGFLVIDAGADVRNLESQSEVFSCLIEVDSGPFFESARNLELNGAEGVNSDEDCSTNAVVPVSAGQHTVELAATGVTEPDTLFQFTTLSAIYVPFGADGSPPSLP